MQKELLNMLFGKNFNLWTLIKTSVVFFACIALAVIIHKKLAWATLFSLLSINSAYAFIIAYRWESSRPKKQAIICSSAIFNIILFVLLMFRL